MLKSENDYHSMKTQCKKWHEILVGCLKDNSEILNINNLYEKMEKFGYDKRKGHLSALICAGQVTRKEALEELKYPSVTVGEISNLKEYVANKFEISIKDLDELFNKPNKNLKNN